MRLKYILSILALLLLPLIIYESRKVQQYLSHAASIPANIFINLSEKVGPINKNWSSFSQGGEEPPPMLSNTVSYMRRLSPRYIRIDHIYDYYNVVQKSDKGYFFDFSSLDKTVDDIQNMGAIPFFSLSYMPRQFTKSGSVIDSPSDWNDWKNLIKATIEHYSGKNTKNINNVYYEVWNEPELPQFGSWKLSGNKDYRLLYFNASLAANEAKDVNRFFLGGPAVGSYYPDWINGILSYTVQNNLRFDFYSWHRYTKKPSEYTNDARNTRSVLKNYSKFADLPIILSEWGFDSSSSELNNTSIGSTHTVTSIIGFKRFIDMALAFEIKDGPPPLGGKWGLISNEKSDPPLAAKSRYYAYAALNNLTGNEIKVTGEGTFVNCIATYDNETVKIILSNYDSNSQNSENVPVTIKDIPTGLYKIKYTYIFDGTSSEEKYNSLNGEIKKQFPMTANTIILIEINPA